MSKQTRAKKPQGTVIKVDLNISVLGLLFVVGLIALLAWVL